MLFLILYFIVQLIEAMNALRSLVCHTLIRKFQSCEIPDWMNEIRKFAPWYCVVAVRSLFVSSSWIVTEGLQRLSVHEYRDACTVQSDSYLPCWWIACSCKPSDPGKTHLENDTEEEILDIVQDLWTWFIPLRKLRVCFLFYSFHLKFGKLYSAEWHDKCCNKLQRVGRRQRSKVLWMPGRIFTMTTPKRSGET